ncbi:SAM-dependent methyltransferase [Sphaerotilaceae bacterium SBD11-9]
MSAARGKLILVPNTLDFGVAGDADLQEVLPLGVLRTASQLTCWVAENAKTTRAFLKRVHAIAPLARPLQELLIIELPRPPKGARPGSATDLTPLLAPALQGHDIGLISEAGLPAVADPGAALVQAAHAMKVEVVSLSGPSSLLLALAASGLNGQSFAFVGYLPTDAGERGLRIRELEALSKRSAQTQLMIETPYRNEALLSALLAHLRGDTLLSVSCGLTLPGAWTRTAAATEWKASPTRMPADIPAVFSLLAR